MALNPKTDATSTGHLKTYQFMTWTQASIRVIHTQWIVYCMLLQISSRWFVALPKCPKTSCPGTFTTLANTQVGVREHANRPELESSQGPSIALLWLSLLRSCESEHQLIMPMLFFQEIKWYFVEETPRTNTKRLVRYLSAQLAAVGAFLAEQGPLCEQIIKLNRAEAN